MPAAAAPAVFYATEEGRAEPVPTVFHSDPANLHRPRASDPDIEWHSATNDPEFKQNPFDFDNLRQLDPNVSIAVFATCIALVVVILAAHRVFPRKCKGADLVFDSAHYINDTHGPKFLESRLGAAFTVSLPFVCFMLFVFVFGGENIVESNFIGVLPRLEFETAARRVFDPSSHTAGADKDESTPLEVYGLVSFTLESWAPASVFQPQVSRICCGENTNSCSNPIIKNLSRFTDDRNSSETWQGPYVPPPGRRDLIDSLSVDVAQECEAAISSQAAGTAADSNKAEEGSGRRRLPDAVVANTTPVSLAKFLENNGQDACRNWVRMDRDSKGVTIDFQCDDSFADNDLFSHTYSWTVAPANTVRDERGDLVPYETIHCRLHFLCKPRNAMTTVQAHTLPLVKVAGPFQHIRWTVVGHQGYKLTTPRPEFLPRAKNGSQDYSSVPYWRIRGPTIGVTDNNTCHRNPGTSPSVSMYGPTPRFRAPEPAPVPFQVALVPLMFTDWVNKAALFPKYPIVSFHHEGMYTPSSTEIQMEYKSGWCASGETDPYAMCDSAQSPGCHGADAYVPTEGKLQEWNEPNYLKLMFQLEPMFLHSGRVARDMLQTRVVALLTLILSVLPAMKLFKLYLGCGLDKLLGHPRCMRCRGAAREPPDVTMRRRVLDEEGETMRRLMTLHTMRTTDAEVELTPMGSAARIAALEARNGKLEAQMDLMLTLLQRQQQDGDVYL